MSSPDPQRKHGLAESDIELLTALQVAPRATWTELSNVLGVHSTTLARRWERLEAAGLARISIAPGIEMLRLGELAFVEVTCQGSKVREVAASLVQDQRVMTVQFVAGQGHLLVTVSLAERSLAAFLLTTLGDMPGLLHYTVRSLTHQLVPASSWHLRALPTATIRRLSQLHQAATDDKTAARPDVVDRTIMTSLSADGRTGYRELGLAADVSPAAAARRLRKLIRSNYISVRCDLAPKHFERSFSAIIWGSLPPDTLAGIDGSMMDRIPALRLVAAVTGASNVHMVLWLKNPSELMQVEQQLLASIEGLRIEDRRLILRTFKYNGAIIDDDGAFGEIIPMTY